MVEASALAGTSANRRLFKCFGNLSSLAQPGDTTEAHDPLAGGHNHIASPLGTLSALPPDGGSWALDTEAREALHAYNADSSYIPFTERDPDASVAAVSPQLRYGMPPMLYSAAMGASSGGSGVRDSPSRTSKDLPPRTPARSVGRVIPPEVRLSMQLAGSSASSESITPTSTPPLGGSGATVPRSSPAMPSARPDGPSRGVLRLLGGGLPVSAPAPPPHAHVLQRWPTFGYKAAPQCGWPLSLAAVGGVFIAAGTKAAVALHRHRPPGEAPRDTLSNEHGICCC